MKTITDTMFPPLRFKDDQGKVYPEWTIETFGNLYCFKLSNSFSREKMNNSLGTVRNIHYGDIHTKFKSQFKLRSENVPFLNSDVDINNISDDMFCKEGDLVVADASEDYVGIGKTIELLSLENEKVLAGLHTLLARLNTDQIYVGFGAYMMDCWFVRKQIMKIAQGTKVLGISMGRLCKVRMPLPSREEQQKIASFLSSIDTRIVQLEKKKSLFEQFKKGLMQRLFGREIRFKNDQGKEYPEWETNRLGELFKIYAGGDIEKRHLSKQQTEEFQYPVFANSTLHKGLQGYSDRYKIDRECITVSGRGTLGIAHVRMKKFYPIVRLLVLIPKLDCNLHFFEYAINELYIFNESTGVPQLTAPQLSKYPINSPNSSEQQKIAEVLTSIDRKIELISKQISQTREFKKGLLQQMFV